MSDIGEAQGGGQPPASNGDAVDDLTADMELIRSLPVVRKMLDIALRNTGMGFAAVARVTEGRWLACEVLDRAQFGLSAGGELPIETTFCDEVRKKTCTVAFDDAITDPVYSQHKSPTLYGIRSYISVPIVLPDGTFFGTLCALDAEPHKVNNPEVIGTFELFAELIAQHVGAAKRLQNAESTLNAERELATQRERFIGVLGHDLRNSIAAMSSGLNILTRKGWTERTPDLLLEMRHSLNRISDMVEKTYDLARIKVGIGLSLKLDAERSLADTLEHIASEIRLGADRAVDVALDLRHPVAVDHERIGQMVSNLLSNAITHGEAGAPVELRAATSDDALTISVANRGKRIPADVLPKLFRPYFSASEKSGLGLGLFIASRIAEAHGGTLTAESDDERTAFTFTMPR